MLKDETRTLSYQTAINELVNPGDVVVDVGCGTGVMSIFAARAGARKVYAIESTPIASIARRIVTDNNLSHVIEVIEADATSIQHDEPADLLVSECMGNFVYSDAMLGVVHKCHRLLKPNGLCCPSSITTWLAPTFIEPIFGAFSWWERPHYDIDFSAAQQAAFNETHNILCPSAQLLRGAPLEFGHIIMNQHQPTVARMMTWTFTEPGPVDGVLGWFCADLSPSVQLETGPGVQTHWGQVFFPTPTFDAKPGDRLEFQLQIVSDVRDLPHYVWQGRVVDVAGRTRHQFVRGGTDRWTRQSDS